MLFVCAFCAELSSFKVGFIEKLINSVEEKKAIIWENCWERMMMWERDVVVIVVVDFLFAVGFANFDPV